MPYSINTRRKWNSRIYWRWHRKKCIKCKKWNRKILNDGKILYSHWYINIHIIKLKRHC